MNNKPFLHINDVFSQHFDKFENTHLYQRLKEKFSPVPYYIKYNMLKRIAILASYLFNFFSGITASTLVYFFILSLAKVWEVAACGTLLFIVLLEVSKRKVGSTFFKDLLQFKQWSFHLLGIGVLLICLSITFSYFGSKKLVLEFSASPEMVSNDSLISPLKKELLKVDEQIAEARATKWKGTTTTRSQDAIAALTRQKTHLQAELIRTIQRTDEQNDLILEQHAETTRLNASQFALLTLLLEMLFLLCAWYIEYYDFRSFAEFAQPSSFDTQFQNGDNDSKPDELPILEGENMAIENGNIDASIVEAAIKNAKANLAAYRSKLKSGYGTVAANKRGINRWKKKVEELEKLLHPHEIETE